MKQHATEYSLDRLKLYLLLAILLVCVYVAIGKRSRMIFYAMIFTCIGISINVFSSNPRLVAQPDLSSNSEMVSSIDTENMIVATTGSVRGYVNTTLKRGVYEKVTTATQLKAIAVDRGVTNATWLIGDLYDNVVYKWNMTVRYDYVMNSVLIKHRNDACRYNNYFIGDSLMPSGYEVKRSYNAETGQTIKTMIVPGGISVDKTIESFAKYGDCFDSVMFEIGVKQEQS